MMKDETLRDVVIRIVDDGESDPTVIAEQARIVAPRNLIEDALDGMLRELARDVLRNRRNLLLSGGTPRTGNGPGSVPVSAKRAEQRQYAAAWLAGSVSIAPGEWKLLADCTAEDLTAAADYNEQLAHANAAKAKRYRRMVDALRRHNADTLGELSEEALRDIESSK